jgi:diguanylate cyclase (GGDEF)-like protein
VVEVGERIRRAVAETTVTEGDQRIGVSVSIGGTTYADLATFSPEELVARADAALYAAKNAGRNRLVLA